MEQLHNQQAYETRELIRKHMPKVLLIVLGVILGACLGAWL